MMRCRRPLILTSVVALAGFSLLAAGCGGGGSPGVAGVASSTTTATTTTQNGVAAFSRCMRSHGVPTFPDPGSDGSVHAAGIDKGSPIFQAAYRSCRALDPGAQLGEQTRTQLQRQLPQLLAFAACMRAHGVPAFPDPEITSDGHTIEFANPGIDTNSPTFTAAAAACRGKLSRDQSSRLFGKLFGGGKQHAGDGGR
jgi:hypothetical protein